MLSWHNDIEFPSMPIIEKKHPIEQAAYNSSNSSGKNKNSSIFSSTFHSNNMSSFLKEEKKSAKKKKTLKNINKSNGETCSKHLIDYLFRCNIIISNMYETNMASCLCYLIKNRLMI